MSLDKMSSLERRAVTSLAAIISLRMIGLFMILPVFALYAQGLPGATPLLIGLAMGIYGLTQAIFQIPFGMMSDFFGRKPIILLGLSIFAAGSMIAAMSDTIYGVLIGRALQGGGAVGSTIIALLADLTRENQRTKAMALNGMTIGVSFSLAMILGPLLSAWIQVSGIFWLAVLFSFIGIALLYTVVPTPTDSHFHSDAEPEAGQFWQIVKDPQLARLNIGVFLLHALFTACFVVIPISLKNYTGLIAKDQWYLYVPALFFGFVFSIVLMIIAEKRKQIKPFFLFGIATLGVAALILCFGATSVVFSALGLLVFFTGFSLLEAFLPSWISRAAPKARKGTALGIYSCSQFFGIFVGGSLGGWLFGTFGLLNVYLFCFGISVVWLAIAFGMKNPQYSSTLPNN